MSFLKLKCTKFDFGWCSAYSAPPSPELDLKWPTSKEWEGRKDGREGQGRCKGRGE